MAAALCGVVHCVPLCVLYRNINLKTGMQFLRHANNDGHVSLVSHKLLIFMFDSGEC